MIGLLSSLEIRNQADQVGVAFQKRLGRFWRQQPVNLAPKQHVLQRIPLGDRLDHHSLGQVKLQPLAPHALVQRPRCAIEQCRSRRRIHPPECRASKPRLSSGIPARRSLRPAKSAGLSIPDPGAGKEAAMAKGAADKGGDRRIVRSASATAAGCSWKPTFP